MIRCLLAFLLLVAGVAHAGQLSTKLVADSATFTGTCTNGAPDYDRIEVAASSVFNLPVGCAQGTRIEVAKIDDSSGPATINPCEIVNGVCPDSSTPLRIGHATKYILPIPTDMAVFVLGKRVVTRNGQRVTEDSWNVSRGQARVSPHRSHRTISIYTGGVNGGLGSGNININTCENDSEPHRILTRTDVGGVTRHDSLAIYLAAASETCGASDEGTYINTATLKFHHFGDDPTAAAGIWLRGGNYDSSGNPVCGASTGGVYDVLLNTKHTTWGIDCRPIFLRPGEVVELYTDGNSWHLETFNSPYGLLMCRAWVASTSYCQP